MSNISYKEKTLFENTIKYYKELKGIDQVFEPEVCQKLSNDIINLIKEYNLHSSDIINVLKSITLNSILHEFDNLINDLESNQLDKFREDLK